MVERSPTIEQPQWESATEVEPETETSATVVEPQVTEVIENPTDEETESVQEVALEEAAIGPGSSVAGTPQEACVSTEEKAMVKIEKDEQVVDLTVSGTEGMDRSKVGKTLAELECVMKPVHMMKHRRSEYMKQLIFLADSVHVLGEGASTRTGMPIQSHFWGKMVAVGD